MRMSESRNERSDSVMVSQLRSVADQLGQLRMLVSLIKLLLMLLLLLLLPETMLRRQFRGSTVDEELHSVGHGLLMSVQQGLRNRDVALFYVAVRERFRRM